MLSVLPKSVSAANLHALQQQLQQIVISLVEAPIDDANAKAMLEKKRLILETVQYLRNVRHARHLTHIQPKTTSFDDHDQVASTLLYVYAQFNLFNSESGRSHPFSSRLSQVWQQINVTHLQQHQARLFPSAPERPKLCDFGILTALEHEYQSVVRRLDAVYRVTSDKNRGFAILDRSIPAEDLKECAKRLWIIHEGRPGWTLGAIANKQVLVVCSGDAGKEHARTAIADVTQTLGVTVSPWLVVGVCASSSERVPIGAVLSASEKVYDIRRTGSRRFLREREIEPLRVEAPKDGRFAMSQCFRRQPTKKASGLDVAKPGAVPVFGVKFACTNEVINETDDRRALRNFLIENNMVSENELFGVEMEGPGVTPFGTMPMCILKSVCDYADDKKGRGWTQEQKVMFQLYAAETAAEYAIQLCQASAAVEGT